MYLKTKMHLFRYTVEKWFGCGSLDKCNLLILYQRLAFNVCAYDLNKLELQK